MATSGAVIARIVSQYSDKGSKAAQKDIAKMGKSIDQWSKKVTKSYMVAGAAVAAFGLKIGKDAVQNAIEDNKSQAALANTLKNVTGATQTQIAAVEEYITKQQKLTSVTDIRLRQGMNNLVSATGDVTTATYLNTKALDFAAGSGEDYEAVTNALAKASKGQFTALGKMFPQLDKATLKTGDYSKILAILDGDYKGAAETVANNDPWTRLKIQFGEVSESLGRVLLPVVIEFTNYLINNVIPKMEEWIELNRTGLQDSLKEVLNSVLAISNNMVKLIGFIEKYKEIVTFIAIIPVFSVFTTQLMLVYSIYKKIMPIIVTVFSAKTLGTVRALGGLLAIVGRTFVAGGIIAGLKSTLQLLSMMSPHLKALLILVGLVTGAVALYKAVFGKGDDAAKKSKLTNEQIHKQQQKAILDGYKITEQAVQKAKDDKTALDNIKKNAAAQKKAADKAKIDAKYAADYAKINASIAKKAGSKLLSGDDEKMVQINAADALLDRQLKNDALNKEMLKRLKEEISLLSVKNDLSIRYDDILKYLLLTQDKLPAAITVLAAKWGISQEAVKAYILQYQIVSDGKISGDEIIQLAKSWGSTQAQAAQYLDFFTALNDGILSDFEIEELKAKWKLTEDQVRMYADFVGVVNDGKLTDSEIDKIRSKWKLTTDQVIAYIEKMGARVDYSGTLYDAADFARIKWLSATDALQKYLDLLKAGTGVIITPAPVVPGKPPVVVPVVPPVVDPGTKSDGNKIKALEEAISLAAYAKAKAAGDMNAAAIAAAGVNPSALAAQENGIIGAASIAAKLKAAEEALAASQAVANQAKTLAAFKDKEARDLATSQAAAAAMDYDERFRHRAAQGVMSASSGFTSSTSSAPANITINVAGSVTSENDLVQTVRRGLLAGQYNGQSLTLEAI